MQGKSIQQECKSQGDFGNSYMYPLHYFVIDQYMLHVTPWDMGHNVSLLGKCSLNI